MYKNVAFSILQLLSLIVGSWLCSNCKYIIFEGRSHAICGKYLLFLFYFIMVLILYAFISCSILMHLICFSGFSDFFVLHAEIFICQFFSSLNQVLFYFPWSCNLRFWLRHFGIFCKCVLQIFYWLKHFGRWMTN